MSRGFTLIEIVVVVAIFVMVLAFRLTISLDSFKRNIFRTEESVLVGVLQKARSRSMSNMFETAHGVCYINPNYIIFRSVCALSPTSELVAANENIASLSDFSNPTKFPIIVFDQLTGKTAGMTIHLTDGVKSADIIINNEGTINW